MTVPKLAKLVSLKATDVWANEPQVFTPWLAENLLLLGEALQLGELELKGTEVLAGDFRLDILAEDEEGNAVLIENQFEATDHRHLGQLISYAASMAQEKRALTIIWVAERFKESHRAAIDWLNANTLEDNSFFAVEIEALKIGDSDPAPFFNVVAKPNNWARSVGNSARDAASGELADRHRSRINYWACFAEFLRANDSTFAIRRQVKNHWVSFSIGRSGVIISATISTQKRRVGVELYFHNDPLKLAIRKLASEKSEIEREFGESLEWQELPTRNSSRIAVYLSNVDPSDQNQLNDLNRWMLDRMQRFGRVFANRVKQLDLCDSNDGDDSEEQHST